MRTSKVEHFVLTNAFGTTINLNLIDAVVLASFIGFRRGEYDANSTTYRYTTHLSRSYRNHSLSDTGILSDFNNIVIDWSKNIYGYDNKIIFRFGHEEEKLTVSEVGKVYTSLIRFISSQVKGLKFPAWRNLSFYSHSTKKFTGYGFSLEYPGTLVEYKDGEIVNQYVISHNTYTDNVSIPRPDFIKKYCFPGEVFNPSRCTFDLSAKTSIRTDKVK